MKVLYSFEFATRKRERIASVALQCQRISQDASCSPATRESHERQIPPARSQKERMCVINHTYLYIFNHCLCFFFQNFICESVGGDTKQPSTVSGEMLKASRGFKLSRVQEGCPTLFHVLFFRASEVSPKSLDSNLGHSDLGETCARRAWCPDQGCMGGWSPSHWHIGISGIIWPQEHCRLFDLMTAVLVWE